MKARQWVIYCADNEWGNETMARLAREKFAADPTLDSITVHEHAGWSLSWNRDMVCIGTANDMARLSPEAYRWAQQFTGHDLVGYERRQIQFEHKYESYCQPATCSRWNRLQPPGSRGGRVRPA